MGRVHSLVRELRFHKPWAMAKKKKSTDLLSLQDQQWTSMIKNIQMLATTLGRKGLYLEFGWSTWKIKMGQPKGTAAEKICLENLLDRNSEFCMTWLWFCKGKDLMSLIIFPSAADYERFFFTKGSLCLMKIEMGTSGEAELEWVPSVVPVIRR